MRDVDLRLAVAYVPGCVCLLKVLVLEFLLTVSDYLAHDAWYVVVCLLLWLDWHYQGDGAIVDASSVLSWIYFAHIVNSMRVHILDFGGEVLFASLGLCWLGMCLYGLARHLGVMARQVSLRGLCVSLESTVFFVGCAGFCPWGEEYRVVRVCRGLTFAALCVVWLYAVDLRGAPSRSPLCAVNSRKPHTVILFLPLLCTGVYVCGLFFVCVCSLLVYSLVPLSPAAVKGDVYSVSPPAAEGGASPRGPVPGDSQDSLELEQMFREARARKNGDV